MANISSGQVITTFTGTLTQGSNSINFPSPFPAAYQSFLISVSGGSGSITNNLTPITGLFVVPNAVSSTYAVNLTSNTTVTFPTAFSPITVANGFCIEFWIFFPSTIPINTVIFGSNSPNQFALTVNGSSQIAIQNSGYFVGGTHPTIIQNNTWYHIAVFGSGPTENKNCISVNGIVINTGNIGGNNASIANGQWNITGNFGNFSGTTAAAPMYVSNFRIVVGSNVYTTSNFTPPTIPLTAITNTKFLTFNSATIVDGSSAPIAITTTNNPTMVSATTPDSNLIPKAFMSQNATASGSATFSLYSSNISSLNRDYVRDARSITTNKNIGWN